MVSPTDQHDDSEPLNEDVVHAFRLPHGRREARLAGSREQGVLRA